MKAEAGADQRDLTRADLQLGELLLNSHRLIAALSESDLLAKHEISLSEWAVLQALGEAQDLPLKEIVRQTGMAVPQIRKVVRDLEAKQLVAVNKAEQPGAPPRGLSAVPKSGRIRAAILADLQGIVSTLANRGTTANQGGKLDQQTRAAKRLANAARVSAQVIRAMAPPRAASFWRKAPTAELSRGIISPERKLVVLHTPKCGGSSLLRSLETAFGTDAVYRDYLHLQSEGARRRRTAMPEPPVIEQPIIYGHFLAVKYKHLDNAMWVTLLREPVDRLLSHYFNWRFTRVNSLGRDGRRLRRAVFNGQISLLDFAKLPGIASSRFFTGFDMKRFDLIIVQDNYNEGIRRVGEKLGVPLSVEFKNVLSSRSNAYEDARRSVTGDPAMMQELREILRAEIEFYQRCLELPSAVVAKTKPQILLSSADSVKL